MATITATVTNVSNYGTDGQNQVLLANYTAGGASHQVQLIVPSGQFNHGQTVTITVQ